MKRLVLKALGRNVSDPFAPSSSRGGSNASNSMPPLIGFSSACNDRSYKSSTLPRSAQIAEIYRFIDITAERAAEIDRYSHGEAAEDILDLFPKPPATLPKSYQAHSKNAFAQSTPNLLPDNPAVSNVIYARRLRSERQRAKRPYFMDRQLLDRSQVENMTGSQRNRSTTTVHRLNTKSSESMYNLGNNISDSRSRTSSGQMNQDRDVPSVTPLMVQKGTKKSTAAIWKQGPTAHQPTMTTAPPLPEVKPLVIRPNRKMTARQRLVSAPSPAEGRYPKQQIPEDVDEYETHYYPVFGSYKPKYS